MSVNLNNTFTLIFAMAVFMPLQQSSAGQPSSSNADSARPITGNYTRQACTKDGGRIDHKNGRLFCILPPAAAKTIVKSKSNITNN